MEAYCEILLRKISLMQLICWQWHISQQIKMMLPTRQRRIERQATLLG
jgi:hypothetical protein